MRGTAYRWPGESTGNIVHSSRIYSNGDLGIDLEQDGVTANDGAPDSDSGQTACRTILCWLPR